MNENKDIKPKSFRIDEETANRFKEIAASIGGNQQQTMAKLIESYEFQSGKAILMDKKADIEQFEKYVFPNLKSAAVKKWIADKFNNLIVVSNI